MWKTLIDKCPLPSTKGLSSAAGRGPNCLSVQRLEALSVRESPSGDAAAGEAVINGGGSSCQAGQGEIDGVGGGAEARRVQASP